MLLLRGTFISMLHHVPVASLIEQYGYLITFLGTFIEGETVLVFSAIAAHIGYLSLPIVIIVATTGATLGDMLFFFIGRYYGTPFVARFPTIGKSTARLNKLIERFPNASIIVFRFIYGLKVSGAVLIGMSHITSRRFIALNVLGSFIWASSITTLSYLFAASLNHMIGRIQGIEKILFVLVAVVVAMYYTTVLVRKQLADVEIEILTSE
jgi:membrane protein DedA with SNARE-associated domain